jgi:hypothetical protein
MFCLAAASLAAPTVCIHNKNLERFTKLKCSINLHLASSYPDSVSVTVSGSSADEKRPLAYVVSSVRRMTRGVPSGLVICLYDVCGKHTGRSERSLTEYLTKGRQRRGMHHRLGCPYLLIQQPHNIGGLAQIVTILCCPFTQ